MRKKEGGSPFNFHIAYYKWIIHQQLKMKHNIPFKVTIDILFIDNIINETLDFVLVSKSVEI